MFVTLLRQQNRTQKSFDPKFATVTNLKKFQKERIWDETKRRIRKEIREDIKNRNENLSNQELTWDNFEADVVKNIAESEKIENLSKSANEIPEFVFKEILDDEITGTGGLNEIIGSGGEKFLKERWEQKNSKNVNKKEKFYTIKGNNKFSVAENPKSYGYF